VLASKPCPLSTHVGEGFVDACPFFFLATEKRDAFAVLADASQCVPILGKIPQLDKTPSPNRASRWRRRLRDSRH
jgi:hypothetical protein